MEAETFQKIKKLTGVSVILDIVMIIASVVTGMVDFFDYMSGAPGNGLILMLLPLLIGYELAPNHFMLFGPNFWSILAMLIKWNFMIVQTKVRRKRDVSAGDMLNSFVGRSTSILGGIIFQILTNIFLATMMFIHEEAIVGEYSKWLVTAFVIANSVLAVFYYSKLREFKADMKYMSEGAKERFINENLL